MITLKNYKDRYSEIPVNELPKGLKDGFDAMAQFTDNGNDLSLLEMDEQLMKDTNTFIARLNDFMDGSGTSKSKRTINASVKRTAKRKAVKTKFVKRSARPPREEVVSKKVRTKTAKPPKTKAIKEPKVKTAKAKKEPKSKLKGDAVVAVSTSVQILKSLLAMHGKVKTSDSLLGLYRKIEKAALDLKIRKTDKYHSEIKEASELLKSLYNKAIKSGSVKVELSEKQLSNFGKIAGSEHNSVTVSILREYANIAGRNLPERAKKLLNRIEKASKLNQIEKITGRYDELENVRKALIEETEDNLPFVAYDLQGLQSTKLMGMHFNTLNVSGKYAKVLGKLSLPFQIMLYGKPGSGKSSMALELAYLFASQHQMKVLFVAKEEGITRTTQEKFERLKTAHKNLYIIEQGNFNRKLGNFDLLIIDSVNEMKYSVDDILAIQKKNPKLAMIQVFKATKTGAFLGKSDYAHAVDAVLKVSDAGIVSVEKSRYGGHGTANVLNKESMKK